MNVVPKPDPIANELAWIGEALHAALTGKKQPGDVGRIGDATLDHLVALGIREGLDGVVSGLQAIASALDHVAQAIESRKGAP